MALSKKEKSALNLMIFICFTAVYGAIIALLNNMFRTRYRQGIYYAFAHSLHCVCLLESLAMVMQKTVRQRLISVFPTYKVVSKILLMTQFH